ncbi:hypothetical protein [Nocardia thailandica]|uniref:hypothetical protein n=1 Tax=Nocardia thailandica TaxID=257275 RepID=UPI00069392D1|nr:hypothetical protein [Nocardia thailandica]
MSSPLSGAERAELERLRAKENARGHRWRWAGVALLLLLTGVLALGSVAARYVHSQVYDTDRYVATIGPLASDPAIRAELADKLTRAVTDRVDIEELTAEAIEALSEDSPRLAERPRAKQALKSLPPLLAEQVHSAVERAATQLVSSAEFAEAWDAANRRAHEILVAVIDGESRRGVEVSDDGTISVSLEPFVAEVQQRLQARGIELASRIPPVDVTVEVFHATELPEYRAWVRALDRAASILPWLTLLAAAGAIALAPRGRRLRAVALTGATWATAMVVLAVAILIGRAIYLDSIPPDVLGTPAATVVFDTFAEPLRLSLRAVGVLGVLIAMIGYLAGPSSSAAAVRSGARSLLTRVRGRREARQNAVEAFTYRFRVPLYLAVVAVAMLALILWPYPTGGVVVGLAVAAAAALLVITFLARPAPDEPDEAEPGSVAL